MSGATATAAARRAALGVGWLPLIASAAVGLLVPALPVWVRYAPLVASVVIFGLPHGAADLVALPRALYGRVTGHGLVIVGGLYLVLGGGFALLWLVAPVPSAVLFLGLTWGHWGQGDVYVLRELFGATHLRM
ncbi:MAG: Brp/Blh family beta-carotene 15,15'-dioxygenase, partial [Haloarculaceae archaeon]